jgi:endonuclease YncB( thermonuclease family)
MMGLLEVSGTLSARQFWPNGTSDADTSKVVLDVGDGGFRFNGKQTKVFDGARVAGKAVVNAKGQVTIRLQGIDAPELHYRPVFRGRARLELDEIRTVNADFRQHLGESAAQALGHFLSAAAGAPTPCVVRSHVKKPNDVFDRYGRLVGDVYIRLGQTEVNLNHWLLQHGWALPSLYNSMENAEIDAVIAVAAAAEGRRAGVWGHPLDDVRKFDFGLTYRKGGPPEPRKDRGPASFPKLFRRVACWRVLKKAHLRSNGFIGYLRDRPDDCYDTANFKAHRKGWLGPKHQLRHLSEFVNEKGRFTVGPADLVFEESPSTLIGAEGLPVKDW